MEGLDTSRLDSALRALATAGKSLRLYPASSPIPGQSIQVAVGSLEEYFAEGHSSLNLTVTRDGFMWHGAPVGGASLGTADLISDLRDHGVAEVSFAPGCSAQSLIGFLTTLALDVSHVRDQGGFGAALAAAGIGDISVVEVRLTVADRIGPSEGEDVESFLRELASDPDRLAAWFASAAAGDSRAFEEGLMELVRVSGPSGFETMLGSLAQAFLAQAPEAKDALLGLSMDPGPVRDLTSGVFAHLRSGDIAASVLGGNYGRNMLSLSSALTSLPLDQVTAQVRAEVQAMLPGTGHSSKESQFLDHMIEVRQSDRPELPLADADRTYRAVLEASHLPEHLIERARQAVAGSGEALTAASVRTMIAIMKQQKDLDLVGASIDAIAGTVPRLVEQGDLELADTVLTELAARAADATSGPELAPRIQVALKSAAGPATMSALVTCLVNDATLLAHARGIVRRADEEGVTALVSASVGLKAQGIEVAETLIGRRVVDELARIASGVPWYQLGPLVARLARESDPRTQAVVESLLRRDEQARKEVVAGLAASPGPLSTRLLGVALADAAAEVAAAAARALGRSQDPAAAAILAERLNRLDIDNADYPLARELIAALAAARGPEADAALEHLANRRVLIKRGHFAEVQQLVHQARRLRQQNGGTR